MSITAIISILFGWLAGVLVNYLADVLPHTRRFSQPACLHCNAPFAWQDYLLFKSCPNGHPRSTRLAGYWGSLVWGIALYLVALKWSRAGWINAAMGVMIYTVAVIYVRPVFSMGFAAAALAGAGMVGVSVMPPAFLNRLILKVIALTNCLYALFDVRSAEAAGSSLQSDADKLANLTGVPAVVWGLLWIGIALPAVCLLLLVVTRRANVKPAPPKAA